MERSGGVVRADPSFEEDDWSGADFDRLVQDARQWRRVGAAALDPQGFLVEVVGGLWGVRADTAGGRFEVAPWVPEGWRSLALRRLRCHRTLLDVEVRPRAEWITVRLSVTFGPSIALVLSVRNAGRITGVSVDEVPLEGRRAIFTADGEHEAVFFLGGDS